MYARTITTRTGRAVSLAAVRSVVAAIGRNIWARRLRDSLRYQTAA